MSKTGIVLSVERNTATILTNTGEFVSVVCHKNIPKIGEAYTGEIKKSSNKLKPLIIAAMFFIIILSGGSAYAYFTPVATVDVSINPKLKLEINRFDRVLKSTPINEDGTILLKNLSLKNKNLDDALVEIIDEATKDNFINNSYNSDGKKIILTIVGTNYKKNIDINKFEEYITEKKLNTVISENGKEYKKEFGENIGEEKKDNEDNIESKEEVNKKNEDIDNKSNVNNKPTDKNSESKGNNDKQGNNQRKEEINSREPNTKNEQKNAVESKESNTDKNIIHNKEDKENQDIKNNKNDKVNNKDIKSKK
ncbi:Anti-sigma factor N-terminus [Clostridium cavendishii DSM 21758]|uniref:Anti-sigma factor N-terminus n=1 Tax=Clostridium cavendishii DSM 21758 TaxID=1121302 RepID=A0A1M6V735_9CLOT|nr:anti-sigma factor domain-containing protein [Clostridium cavendishii]SHK77126.1 Anti-sigma factor N-terminus [Clostridium cavendishii DSM 21758]